MKRVTCREIAKKLGLSHVAVSMALRNHPSLPASTKEKVCKLAVEMGYRPDPVLNALNAYRQANKTDNSKATLAWINPYPKSRPQALPEWLEPATRRAQAHGFRLERFWVPTYEDWNRLARTLRSRNIQGLVRTPGASNPHLNPEDPETWPWRDFPWEDFSANVVGASDNPKHHRVTHHHFQGAALAVSELFALGYRKIGIILSKLAKGSAEYPWLGGYLAECARLGLSPLYVVGGGALGSPDYAKHVAEWILKNRPEAVISPGDGEILPALRLAKLRTPDDIAVAVLSTMGAHPELAHVYQNAEQIGTVVIDQLVDLIRRNERGIPALPLRYYVDGVWIPGASAPPKKSK